MLTFSGSPSNSRISLDGTGDMGGKSTLERRKSRRKTSLVTKAKEPPVFTLQLLDHPSLRDELPSRCIGPTVSSWPRRPLAPQRSPRAVLSVPAIEPPPLPGTLILVLGDDKVVCHRSAIGARAWLASSSGPSAALVNDQQQHCCCVYMLQVTISHCRSPHLQ